MKCLLITTESKEEVKKSKNHIYVNFMFTIFRQSLSL